VSGPPFCSLRFILDLGGGLDSSSGKPGGQCLVALSPTFLKVVESPPQNTQEFTVTNEEEDRYKRALAQIENMRKQTAVAVSRAREQGEENIACLLLDAIDDFARATNSLKQKGIRKKDAIRGIDMALGHLIHKLLEIGIQAVPAEGMPFDPQTMEAVAEVPSAEIPHHHVAGQVRQGYTRKGKLLRPAQVAVAISPEMVDA